MKQARLLTRKRLLCAILLVLSGLVSVVVDLYFTLTSMTTDKVPSPSNVSRPPPKTDVKFYISALPRGRLGNPVLFKSALVPEAFDISYVSKQRFRGFRMLYEKGFATYDPSFERLPPANVTVVHFLQSWRYFHRIQETIRSQFVFRPYIRSKSQQLLNKLTHGLGNVTTVGVHVRRGDYVRREAVGNFRLPPVSFYHKAADHFRRKYGPDVVFIVVTQDPVWVTLNLRNEDFILADPASPTVHLSLLTQCDHVIVSLGTFGWWGGYLGGGEVVFYNDCVYPNMTAMKDFKASSQEVAGRAAKCLDIQDTMAKCLAILGRSFTVQPNNGFDVDLNVTKQLCEDGRLRDAMTCLETEYNRCADMSSSRHRPFTGLDFRLNSGMWRDSMDKLCAHIDYFREHEQCTRLIAVESSHCIQRESQKSLQELTNGMRAGHAGQADLMKLSCSFARNVTQCFKGPMDRDSSVCPCRYRQLVEEVVANSMPEACQPNQDYYYNAFPDDCYQEVGAGSDAGSRVGYDFGSYNTGTAGKHNVKGNPVVSISVQKPPSHGHEGTGNDYQVQDISQVRGHRGQGAVTCPVLVRLTAGMAAAVALWLL